MQGFMSVNRMFNDLQPTVGAAPRVCPPFWKEGSKTVCLPQINGPFKRADTGVCPYAWNIALEKEETTKKKMQPTDNQQVAKSLFSAPMARVFVLKKKKAQKVFMRFVKNNPILTVL